MQNAYNIKIQQPNEPPKQGRLKIFFGYAAGVGKTYAMLEAAHDAKNKGVDVVVGYVERHTRPDTLALLEGLEVLPNRIVEYHGIELKEFDIDAVLKRRPQLVLIDELAHSNAPGCRHTKRYQDVEEILRAGIDVYSTINVQHLESLNDLVESITKIAVSERIPDSVVDAADQVEVVDIEPEDLINRLQSGKVYQKKQASRALDNFFVKDNLAALREIALRRTADRLSKNAKKARSEAAKASEHILVCLSGAPSNTRVIRTAARMAEAFHSGFTALFVETSETKEMKEDEFKRLRSNMRLAEQLGAQIVTVYGEEPAEQIAEYARLSGITKIVLGRTNHPVNSFLRTKTLADQLTGLVGDIDIYIIPDPRPIYTKRRKGLMREEVKEFRWVDFLKAVGVTALATLISVAFYDVGLREANLITVYILGVLLTAVWTRGYLYSALASLLSVLAFNFFFTEPRFTLTATEPDYPITFGIMLVAGLLSSSLAIRVKKQARLSAQKAYSMEILINSNQKLAQGQDEEEIIRLAAEQVNALLDRPILYALVIGDKERQFRVYPESEAQHLLGAMNAEERGVADWVVKNNKHAGATTNTLQHAQNLYLSVRGNEGVMGVIGVPAQYYPDIDAFQKNLMISILNECGLILERRRLLAEKQASEMEIQQERLRANLLRAISHDLRTPLTSISGNASVLMTKSLSLDEEKKQEIYSYIYNDAEWLMNLTENLLSITRIDNGTMQLRLSTELVEDVFHEAVNHIDHKASEHVITTHLDDDFLMAKMDARLIVQVIINILNNAIKYTPKGSHIDLSAKRQGKMVSISIADDGAGISDEAKEHLFDMFYTAENGKPDSRRGLGLGLSLCKSIVTAHGGEISVRDNSPQGSVFTFTLPLEEVNIEHV